MKTSQPDPLHVFRYDRDNSEFEPSAEASLKDGEWSLFTRLVPQIPWFCLSWRSFHVIQSREIPNCEPLGGGGHKGRKLSSNLR